MNIKEIDFSGQKVSFCFDADFTIISQFKEQEKILVLVDEQVLMLNPEKFADFKTLTIVASEAGKTQATVDDVILQMLDIGVDKSWLLVGVGGGVVTDIAGYIASIYKRGIQLGLVPTTILGIADASIGGKNGVNVGIYKNMVGTTYRPKFILYDYSFLNTLPMAEWINGFAEIIKHACIKDAAMFADLETHSIQYYFQHRLEAIKMLEKNVMLKVEVVQQDEFENADRFQLNFGHSFGHALENLYNLPHGHAISIGMVMAARISEEINNFDSVSVQRIQALLLQYNLPVKIDFDKDKVLNLLTNDKKTVGNAINYVLLDAIGEASVHVLPFNDIHSLVDQIF